MPTQSSDFDGLRVVAFESRRGGEMARLIQRHGGHAMVSPSMREVPVETTKEVADFANRLLTGQVDVVILTTGVGTRALIEQALRHVERGRFLSSLADVTTIVRGPKPVAALKSYGVTPTYRAAEPNTWREVLAVIDAHLAIAGSSVALQEYGQRSPSLVAGLEARGAKLECLKLYRWELPEDSGPLVRNIQAIAAGDVDVVLFTSSPQLQHVLEIATRLDLLEPLHSALQHTIVASIGPTTSASLAAAGLPVDLEPEHSKMGQLVAAAAAQAPALIRRKKQIASIVDVGSARDRHDDTDAPWYQSPFMKACRCEPVPYTPVWLMRQAGRYMAEYRAIREKTTFLELVRRPDLCSEIMVTAVRKLGVDAAILFSDLLPILEPMGMDLEYAAGEGPVIHNPIRESGDLPRFLELESTDALHFVIAAVRQTRADLPPEIPLIGFAGAPFTLASYAIEGGASRNYLHTKTLMYRDAGAWDALMTRLARAVARYLNAQIAAGAQCVQLFDSWAGCLGPDDYRQYVLPFTKGVIDAMPPGVPVINFATGNPALLPLLAQAGGAVIGVDWRIRLDDAWRRVGERRAVQGNLDPTVLLADRTTIRRRAREILDQADGRPGHIFNLGHGVLQQTPVESAVALVEMVHEMTYR